MAFFYIESTGTRTSGGSQTKKTGAWSSIAAGDKYADHETCANDASPPVDGDIVCWRVDDTQNITVNSTATFADGVILLSTSAADCDVYAEATADQVTTDEDIRYRINETGDAPLSLVLRGMRWSYSTYAYWSGASKLHFMQTRLVQNAAGRVLGLVNGARVVAVDSAIDGPTTGTKGSMLLQLGGAFVGKGGEMLAATSSNAPCFDLSPGGGSAHCFATDFSGRPVGSAIVDTGAVTDQLCNIDVVKSTLPTSWGTETTSTHAASFVVENCDSRYQYEQIGYSGDISFVTDVYYTTHATMDDGTTKGSLYFDANADCSPYAPLKYGDYSSGRWLMKDNQSAATLNTLRVFFVTHSADSLDKGDVQIECMYADTADTSKVLFAKHINPIINDSPGALSTETTSAKWTDSGSNSLATTSYYFDLDLTSEGNGLVYWTLALTKADVEMWLSWECEFV